MSKFLSPQTPKEWDVWEAEEEVKCKAYLDKLFKGNPDFLEESVQAPNRSMPFDLESFKKTVKEFSPLLAESSN